MQKNNLGRFALGIVPSIYILIFSLPVNAELVYSVLLKEAWEIYYQVDFSMSPKPVGGIIRGDKNAAVLSNDGKHVAFEAHGGKLYVCPLITLQKYQPVRVDHASAVRPVWHPKTNEIVFTRYITNQKSEESDLFITQGNLTTSAPLITQTGLQDYPDISPDGQGLAYTSASTIQPRRGGLLVIQQIWIMDLQTGSVQQLMLSNAQDTHPDWAPSGQEIAFASNRTGQFEIWTVKADGSNPRQVTSGPGAKTWPAWSPDGKSIMFTLTKDGHQRLWIIDADGSNLRQFEPFGPGSDVDVRDADWR